MKLKILTAFITLIAILNCKAQDAGRTITQSLKETEKPVFKAELDKEFTKGSKFHLEHVSQEQIEKLYKLCKIWGFLKYYHPETAKGNINWDYELFRVLPMINAEEFDKNLFNWVKAIGPVKHAEIKKDLPNIKMKPDTKWLSDSSFLSSGLSRVLTEIAASEKERSHYYIGFAPNIGNPVFKNENPYPDMQWNDTGYRLLALFRYWNMIEYFFPYKYLTDKDWNDVLREYIPKMISSGNELSYKLTILTLIGEVHDTHANIWQKDSTLDQFYGKNIAPIEVKTIEGKTVVTQTLGQLNSSSKIKKGDIITRINNVPIEEVIKDKIRYCPASNYPTRLRNVSWRLLRTNEDTLSLTIEGQAGTYTETVNAVNFYQVNFAETKIPSHKELENNIGYIYPGTLKKGEIDGIMGSFKRKKGIIIDLRCYPSDFIVFSLGKYLMRRPTEFVKFTFGSLDQPGLFLSSKPLKVGNKRRDFYKSRIIILVNEYTQSQAEYTAMALRAAPHAQVIGSTTAGADGNVSRIMLPGNISTMISGLGIYYPDGTETQRVGIVPDTEIKPTISGIRAGKDEVLLKAVELINQ